MVKQYETTFIVDAHLQTEQIESAVTKYTQMIEKASGKIRLIDRWGKRRLAYEIAKKQYGYYVYVRFEAPGDIVDALEKEFKLDETILRHLVLRVPKVVLRDEELEDSKKPESAPVAEAESAAVKEADKKEEKASTEETSDSTSEDSEDSGSEPAEEKEKAADDA